MLYISTVFLKFFYLDCMEIDLSKTQIVISKEDSALLYLFLKNFNAPITLLAIITHQQFTKHDTVVLKHGS